MKLLVDATNNINQKRLPGIIMLRGGSVALLISIIDQNTNQRYYLFTQQIRLATTQNLVEITAGMLDNNGDISGVAVKEVQEETGIKIDKKDLVYLGQAYSSPGLLDELITYYSLTLTLTTEEINAMKEKIYGEENSSETIKLQFIENGKINNILDGKFYTALGLLFTKKSNIH